MQNFSREKIKTELGSQSMSHEVTEFHGLSIQEEKRIK